MNKQFWVICITHMFIEVYFLTQVALIPIFIQEFQLSILQASLVASIPSLTQLLMNIPLGPLVDRVNAKHFLFAGMLIEGSSALFLSQTNSFWMLVLGVSVMRISSPIYHISGLSFLSRSNNVQKMSRTMGFHNSFGSLGSAIGVISLAFFLSTLGWRWIYLFWAIPVLSWGFIILNFFQFKTEKLRAPTKGRNPSRLRLVFFAGFVTFLIVVGLREMGSNGILTFMTTYLETARGLHEVTATLIFGLGPLMGIVGSLSGGYLGERVGAKKALSLIILGCAISLVILMSSSHLFLLTLIYLIFTTLSYSAYVPMNTMIAEITPSTERGTGFSAYFFTEGLVISITPIILAWVIGLTEVWYIFPFSIIFLISSLAILQFIRYPRITRREH
ncbi:MAG: MFS transporter [Candidatus Bathyarchaeota archaeon]|nr:MFS transporter [Candidatus Bathyarchaeota archaeon]